LAQTRSFPTKPRTIEHCPDFSERMTLVDGLTKAVAYPAKGYNCNPDNYYLAQAAPAPKPYSVPKKLEHCPDFVDRFTLVDGRTDAVAYPKAGFNCNPDYHFQTLVQQKWAVPVAIEHCPDFYERFTLVDGRTNAVPYPQKGYNCDPDMHTTSLVQSEWSVPAHLEHCPDFYERFTLVNGRTNAIPYPQKGYNCDPDFHTTESSLLQTDNK